MLDFVKEKSRIWIIMQADGVTATGSEHDSIGQRLKWKDYFWEDLDYNWTDGYESPEERREEETQCMLCLTRCPKQRHYFSCHQNSDNNHWVHIPLPRVCCCHYHQSSAQESQTICSRWLEMVVHGLQS